MPRIVFAFSGGPDTSAAIEWLKHRPGDAGDVTDVVTVTLDLGQGGVLEEVRDRALARGAARAHVLDAREEFASDYIARALKADAVYEDRYPMATSLGRPLIAKKLVEVAAIEQATIVAHTGTGNDQIRLDVCVRALNPGLTVIAVPPSATSSKTVDANLWGRAIQYGAISDPWTEAPEEVYTLTRAPGDCPDEAAYVELSFQHGVPVAINGVEMPILELLGSLGIIAGAHGVGRIDMVENRVAGIKARAIYEAPAAVVLHAAHKELQKMVVSTGLDRFSRAVSLQYADTIYNGLWFTPLREALDAFIDKVQERVTGVIRMKLFKGDCRVVGRKSPFALYEPAATAGVPTTT